MASPAFAHRTQPSAGPFPRLWRWPAIVVLAAAVSIVMNRSAAAQTETVLVNLTGTTGAAPAANPYGNLIQASDGNFYGTSTGGGANGYGTIFEVNYAGAYTVLHSFSNATNDGESPQAGLVEGVDGSLYGTTFVGGANGYGTVFKINAAGTLTVLHSFSDTTADGYYPNAGLVQGTDGNFYGTTYNGGANSYGTVFKITPAGTFTLLHSFSSATTDGYFPAGTLVQGTDGNFYGTTSYGGANGEGTVFKITSAGSFTLLHSFAALAANTDGYEPTAGLVQGTDGQFYGTAAEGGANGDGTLFKITSTGTFTLLHTFAAGTSDGSHPYAGLVQATDGSFYGTTGSGGANASGTLFKIGSTGTFALLHAFSAASTDGNEPESGLVQGADGNLYGTTYSGGNYGQGTFFKLVPAPTLAGPITLTVPASVNRGASFTLGYSVANAYSDTLQQCFATNNGGDTTGWTGILTGGTATVNASLSAPAVAGGYTYALTCGGIESGLVTLNVSGATPATASVSAVTAPFGSTAGVTVTATESGTSGVVTGGVVTFSASTGSFSPATCTLSSSGTCSTTYLPSGTLAAGTYPNGIQASFAANNAYFAATGAGTLTITTVTPTASVSAVTVGYQVTTPITVTATESSPVGSTSGSVVTFGLAGAATGSFNPTTCTLANGSCTTSYIPTGTLAFGTYPNAITASFTASGNFTAGSASSSLTIDGESVLVNLTGTSGAAPGSYPGYASLIQASDGNFYGTVDSGGANGFGTVFKITPAGAYTLLHSFSSAATDGETPFAGLVEGTDGNFYGTTLQGGANGFGSVFQITSTGGFTLLHSFSSATTDGETPYAGLVQGTDGNFYGTTSSGGANGFGTVFKIGSTGSFALVHSFSSAATDGETPYAGLVQGTDGNLYGTTNAGGASTGGQCVDALTCPGGYGTVFKVSPTGTFSLLHSFSTATTDGELPQSATLIQGTDGNFYGTTVSGGANGNGTVFRLTPTGSFTLLHSFSTATTDGRGPQAGLVQGSDGSFYGSTANGGANADGTFFKITSAGTFTLLHSFSTATTDGASPYAGLVQGADGSFYGTTFTGGTNAFGAIVRLLASPALSAPVTLSVPSSVAVGAAFTLNYSVANAPPTGASAGSLQQCFATNSAGDTTGWVGVKTATTTAANASLTAPSSAGSFTYTLTCGGVESSSVTLNVVAAAPTTASVSAVSAPYGSTAGITVTATESGLAGVTTGGVVSFSVVSPATGSFNPASCTLTSAGTCTTTYYPTGSLSAGTYANDIQASFAANNAYSAAAGTSTLTIAAASPTIAFSVPTHHTIDAPFTVSATSNSGGTLTYSVVSGPATVSGSTVTLTGAGGTVQLLASQAASGNYAAASQPASFSVVAGSVWLGNSAGSLSIFGSDGAALQNASGAGLGTIPTPLAEAFDSSGRLWVASANGVSAFTGNGAPVQSTAFTAGSISNPVSLAVDGAGLIWIANANSTLSVLNGAGAAVSPATGYPATATGTPGGLTVDLSGNVWVTNQNANTVTEILGAATPAAPPSTALANGTTGAKP